MDKEPDPTERVRLQQILEEMDSEAQRVAFLTRVRYPDAGVIRNFRRWMDNLFAESHLQRGTWRALIQGILELPHDASEEAVFEACVGVFRSTLASGRPLTGPEAQVPEHRCLGRVVPREDFQKFLRDKAEPLLPPATSAPAPRRGRARGYGGSGKSARQFLTHLMKREVMEYPDCIIDVALHDHLMWATFSDDRYPFTGFPTKRRTLCCVLGLLDLGSDELIQLVYGLPDDRTPHIPTIAEAYAGGAWGVLFQPSHPGAKVGRTIPRTECADERTRPEVVHRPVRLRHLSARIRVI